MADKRLPVIRFFRLRQVQTSRNVAELVNVIRSVVELPRIAQLSNPKAFFVRGDAETVALADWLTNQLDSATAAPAGAAPEYPVAGRPGEVVRLVYLSGAVDRNALAALINNVRTASPVQRIGWYTQSRALAMRGTADQLAAAERVISERDKI